MVVTEVFCLNHAKEFELADCGFALTQVYLLVHEVNCFSLTGKSNCVVLGRTPQMFGLFLSPKSRVSFSIVVQAQIFTV